MLTVSITFCMFQPNHMLAILTSWRTCQEPSEEPFDISLVSREAKSRPLQDKKAPGKKPPAGAPALAPVSAVDTYQKVLSSIAEFSGFGRLFKVCRINTFKCFWTSSHAKSLFFPSRQNLCSWQRQRLNMRLTWLSTYTKDMLYYSTTAPTLYPNNC